MEIVRFAAERSRACVLIGLAAVVASAGLSHAASLGFAVIGDYGYSSGTRESRVATMVNGWNPAFIATTGDNNYGDDGNDNNYDHAGPIASNITNFYGSYISNDTLNSGSPNRFFPVLGNADWGEEGGNFDPSKADHWYQTYFSHLPSNGRGAGIDHRYYTVAQGTTTGGRPLVQLFMLDDDAHDPDFSTTDPANSVEGQWLKNSLAASNALYKLVITHHAPYTSGDGGVTLDTRLPYKSWGASVVLAGHAHIYERLSEPDPGMTANAANNLPYLVDGLGGRDIQGFIRPFIAGSQAQYENDYGALKVLADETQLTFQFWSVGNTNAPIDSFSIAAPTPEPASIAVLLLGGGLLGARRRRA